MGFLSTILGILGFGVGLPLGLLLGFFFFVYSEPQEVRDPEVRPFDELDSRTLQDILPEIPFWVKCPDYERVDWFNKFLLDMWPYLDKAICGRIRSMAQPIFSEYVGNYMIESIEFENLTLGTLPPTVHGVKVYETNEKDLVMEPAIKWAGNPNIIVVIKIMSLSVTVQLVDLQIFASLRVALRALVSTFPCFASIVVSLMERPHVDFGMKILGADVMAIPVLYRLVQETIKSQVATLYLWPQTLEIPVLDSSTVAIKKPVGILHAKVVCAKKLLKADLVGTSDPYVTLSLTGDNFPAKKTTIKKNNLNPKWNESFKLIVREPESQVLQLQVFDWDQVGGHDRLGMQMIPLKVLTPHKTREFTLDLLKHANIYDAQDTKKRGKIMVELTFVPFKLDSIKSIGSGSGSGSGRDQSADDETLNRAGLLTVIVQGAEGVEGKKHNNPYAIVIFKGEKKKTKVIKRNRYPQWNEEFQFTLDHPPLNEKIHIEVKSKRTRLSIPSKESLGHVEINLDDVVHNGRINEKYHLIDSKNGVLHVETRWIAG